MACVLSLRRIRVQLVARNPPPRRIGVASVVSAAAGPAAQPVHSRSIFCTSTLRKYIVSRQTASCLELRDHIHLRTSGRRRGRIDLQNMDQARLGQAMDLCSPKRAPVCQRVRRRYLDRRHPSARRPDWRSQGPRATSHHGWPFANLEEPWSLRECRHLEVACLRSLFRRKLGQATSH